MSNVNENTFTSQEYTEVIIRSALSSNTSPFFKTWVVLQNQNNVIVFVKAAYWSMLPNESLIVFVITYRVIRIPSLRNESCYRLKQHNCIFKNLSGNTSPFFTNWRHALDSKHPNCVCKNLSSNTFPFFTKWVLLQMKNNLIVFVRTSRVIRHPSLSNEPVWCRRSTTTGKSRITQKHHCCIDWTNSMCLLYQINGLTDTNNALSHTNICPVF